MSRATRVLIVDMVKCDHEMFDHPTCPWCSEDGLFTISYCMHPKILRQDKDGNYHKKRLPKQPAVPPKWCPLPKKEGK